MPLKSTNNKLLPLEPTGMGLLLNNSPLRVISRLSPRKWGPLLYFLYIQAQFIPILAHPLVDTSMSAEVHASSGDTITNTTLSSSVATSVQLPSIRALETALMALSAGLLTITYAMLIGPGTRLSSTSKLPLASIEENMSNLLSRTWPDTSKTSDVTAADETNTKVEMDADVEKDVNVEKDAIRLFYVGKMIKDDGRMARGVEQCEAIKSEEIITPPMWLTSGSSLTKSIVELAIWEWVSLWMALAMITSTLAFNGFFTGARAVDSYPRLVVILIYTVAFLFHAWYVWRIVITFLTLATAGSTWSMLNKASFSSVDLIQLENRHKSNGPSPVFKQVGKPRLDTQFPAYEARLFHENLEDGVEPQEPNANNANDPDTPEAQKGAADTVFQWQRAEILSTIEAGNVALESIVTNVMTMVGIIIATGFSVWTSNASDDISQLGSLSLLVSLSLGIGAMFRSVVNLSVMEDSFRNVLFLKEVMINGKATDHVQKRVSKGRVIGFTHGTIKQCSVRAKDLAKMCSWWGLLLFGPAYVLLPSKDDHARQSAAANFEIHVSVRGKHVLFTTATTDKHAQAENGQNIEAINVCYDTQPRSKPSHGKSRAIQWALPFNKVGTWLSRVKEIRVLQNRRLGADKE